MVDNIAVVDRGAAAPGTVQGSLRSRVVNTNIYTTDITDKFRVATSNLPLGTLVKDEQFTLFESVGALEIGDPKMDSGCQAASEDPDEEYDVTQLLSPAQVLWLMDELLSREVAWQSGYPLSQTLFTSYYIDDLLWPNPRVLSDASFGCDRAAQAANPLLHLLFRGFCLGLIKCCDLVLKKITSQHYYEEEDFATQLFNRELLSQFAADDVIAVMWDGLAWLELANLDPEIQHQLRLRVHFRIELLGTLLKHNLHTACMGSINGSDIKDMRAGHIAAVEVSNAFSPRIQRRLASSVPPRPMIRTDIYTAFDFWEASCRNMKDVFSVLSTTQGDDLLTSLSLLNGEDPQPSLYIRALMQSFLSQDGRVLGDIDIFDFILGDLRSLTIASSSVSQVCNSKKAPDNENERTVQQGLQDFVVRIEQPYLNNFRALCLNRPRLRRTLCHAVMEWDQIQAEAEDLDDFCHRILDERAQIYPIVGGTLTHSYPVSSWIYHHKLEQIRLIVQMGFELDVYAPYELAAMYWYLAHICDTHLAHLERVSFFVAQCESSLRTTPSIFSTAGKMATPTKQAAAILSATEKELAIEQCQSSQAHLFRHFALLKASESLARALHYLYSFLHRHKQLPQPTPTYSTDGLRHQIRMKPFQFLSVPEPLAHEEFVRYSSLEHQGDQDILDGAAEFSRLAHTGWQAVLANKWHCFPLRPLDHSTIDSGNDILSTPNFYTSPDIYTNINTNQSSPSVTSSTSETMILEVLHRKNIEKIIKATSTTATAIETLKEFLNSPPATTSGTTSGATDKISDDTDIQRVSDSYSHRTTNTWPRKATQTNAQERTISTSIPVKSDGEAGGHWHDFWRVPVVTLK